jgi:hypothetical protein
MLFNEICKLKNILGGINDENGDLQETTSSVELLPSFLEGQTATIRKAYETAVTVKGLLPYIPCYCGCGESAGHQSNLNCFHHQLQFFQLLSSELTIESKQLHFSGSFIKTFTVPYDLSPQIHPDLQTSHRSNLMWV